MARSDPQINIRVPEELKAQLDSSALRAGRSLTSEIVTRLQETFAREESPAEAAAREAEIRNSPLFRELQEGQRKFDSLTPKEQARVQLEAEVEQVEAELSLLLSDRAYHGQLLNDLNFRLVAAKLDQMTAEEIAKLQGERDEKVAAISIAQREIERKMEMLTRLKHAVLKE
ncbi:Arc family DNA-binding protein [Paucibacter sp. O1-1]|nr:Arc family DNA-binding protein [Paucibacter sp. O1-1]MDA3827867.1 Arc family DNA-binding protein [Paucibacter sp. O1-1]